MEGMVVGAGVDCFARGTASSLTGCSADVCPPLAPFTFAPSGSLNFLQIMHVPYSRYVKSLIFHTAVHW